MRSILQEVVSPSPSLFPHPPPFTNESYFNTSPPILPPPPNEYPPPPSPPPPDTIYGTLLGVDNVVSDESVLQTMWICTVLGVLCLLGFSIWHNRWKFYKIRLHLGSVSVPPPPIVDQYPAILSWLINVLTVNDLELLATAGLDALMLVKVCGLGIKIFVPFTFIGLVVLVPMHRFTAEEINRQANKIGARTNSTDTKVKLSVYSMANLEDKHNMFWLHFVLVYVYIFYVMALLRWQYYNYVKLRQHYMVAGNDMNYWRQVVSRASFNKRQQYSNLMASLELVRNWKRTLTSEDEEARPDGVLDPEQIQANLPTSRAASSLSEVINNVLTPMRRVVRSARSHPHTPPAQQTMISLTPAGTSRPMTKIWQRSETVDSGTLSRAHSEIQPVGTMRTAFGFLGSKPPSKSGRLPSFHSGDKVQPTVDLQLEHSSSGGRVGGSPSTPTMTPTALTALGQEVRESVRSEVRDSMKSEGRSPEIRASMASVNGPGPVGEGTEGNGHLGGKTPKSLRKTDSLPVASKDTLDSLLTHRSNTLSLSESFYNETPIRADQGLQGLNGIHPFAALPSHFRYGSVDGAKWWTRVLVHHDPQDDAKRPPMLSKPSVRHRTTINTINRNGLVVSVNAAQYTVLVTDVPEDPFTVHAQKPARKYRFGLGHRAVAQLPAFLAIPILRYVFLTDVQRDELRMLLAYADEATDKIVRVDDHPSRAITQMEAQYSEHDGIQSAIQRYKDLQSPSAATGFPPRGRSFMSNHSSRRPSFAYPGPPREYPIKPPPIVIPTFSSPRSNTSPNVSARVTSEAELTALSPGSSTSYLTSSKPPVPPLKFATAKATTPAGEGCFPSGRRGFLGRDSGEGQPYAPTYLSLDSPFKPPNQPYSLPTVMSGVPVDASVLELPHHARKSDDRGPFSSTSRSSSDSRTAQWQNQNPGQSQSQSAGEQSAGEEPGSKWALVRQAIDDGRIFHLPQDIVTRTFRKLFPQEFDRAVPVFRHDKVDRLLMKWDYHQRRLEHALAVEEASDGPIQAQERVCCDCCCLCCNCCACCSWNRELVVSVPYHMQKIEELEKQIVDAQQEAFCSSTTPTYIAFFKTQTAATLAANSVLHAEDQTKFQVHAAPGPENVNWETLWFTYSQREARAYAAFPVKVIVLAFPISILSGALTSLDSALCSKEKETGLPGGQAPFIDRLYCDNGTFPGIMRLILTGLLPSVLLSLWQNMVIPRSLHYVAQMESKSISLSGLEQRMLSMYFVWSVMNVVQGVLGQVITSTITVFIKEPQKIFTEVFDVLGRQLPTASNFFFNYVWYRGVTMLPYRLFVPHMGFWCFLIQLGGNFKKGFSKRDVVDLLTTRSIRHGIELGLLLYIFCVGFVYCLVSPLLCPVVLAYFICAYIMWRNSVLYLNVRKYESGGSLWPNVFDRICVCLFIMQLFMTSLMLVKQAYYQGLILLFTVPFILRKFHRHCHLSFEMGVKFTPLELAKDAPTARVDPMVYIPPPLQPGCVGWHPEWMKTWEGFGQPMYTA